MGDGGWGGHRAKGRVKGGGRGLIDDNSWVFIILTLTLTLTLTLLLILQSTIPILYEKGVLFFRYE